MSRSMTTSIGESFNSLMVPLQMGKHLW
jgi:hypothetical protein